MYTKKFALVSGIVLLGMGLLSLVPSLSVTGEVLLPLALDVSYGLFVGIFPLNILNKLAMIAFGLAGIQAWRLCIVSERPAITYSWIMFWGMAPLAVLGMIPMTNTLFGYWPLYGNEVVIHSFFSLMGLYFAAIAHRPSLTPPPPHFPSGVGSGRA